MPYKELDTFMAGTKVVTEGLRLKLPNELLGEWEKIDQLMKVCFLFEPNDRPTFEGICDFLDMNLKLDS